MITFVATAHKEKYDPYILISSLLLQKDSRWKCIVCCDGPNEDVDKCVSMFNDPRISVHTENNATGFWGHKNRKMALENLVDTDFIIQTSIQDYYIPTTVKEILKFYETFDLIYFNCLHHHINYEVLKSKVVVNKIDWGSFAVRTFIAKKVGIKDVTSSSCDGKFVENCLKYDGIRIIKIEKTLTVHN